MRILLVHNSYQQRGGEDVVFEQERELLQRAGHHVSAYQRNNRELDERSAWGKMAAMAGTVWSERSRREFAAHLAAEAPDVVHVHNTFILISPSIYWACRNAGIPVVQTLHNYRLLCPAASFYRDGHVCEDCLIGGLCQGVRHGCYRESRSATAVVAAMLKTHRALGTWTRMVDAYIALSDFSRQKFIAAGLPAEKIRLKPNFVAFDPGVAPGDGEYALFVGRLSPEKGLRLLLEAWRELPASMPLRIVGGGPLESELRTTARDMANVTFTGALARREVLAAMKRARFVVCPSELYENFPMSIVEAFACGVPVLASRLGAMQEIVQHGRTGMSFTPGSAADLAAKARWLWQHPAETRRMGKAARGEYLEKYTAEANYQMLMRIYRQFVGANEVRAA